MTRKDYVNLAAAIAAAHKRIVLSESIPQAKRVEQLRGVRRTAAHICDALVKDNPDHFDAARFLTACGYGATTIEPAPRDPALDLRPLQD